MTPNAQAIRAKDRWIGGDQIGIQGQDQWSEKVTHKMRENIYKSHIQERTLYTGYRKGSYNSDLKDEWHSLDTWPRIQMDASTRLNDKWPTMREDQYHLSTGRWGVIPHPLPNKGLIMIRRARAQQNGKSSGTAGGDKRWQRHFRRAWQLIKR